MARSTVNLPEDVRQFAEMRASESGHRSVDDYVASLIRADVEQDVSAELEEALLEGLASGPPIEVTPRFWQDLKRRGRGRAEASTS